ncbi:MAG: ribosomal protein S18-alanine N-acetyltransferase [Candidatus Bathyarchaeota archaeon]|nr:ribosomal protein S18-alanine N-acetyltransferase [Candidatus Bathyarchaeota archaeon]
MEITIEYATSGLLEELHEIERQCFKKEAFSKNELGILLTAYNSVGLIARVNHEVAGFIIGAIEVNQSASIGHILTVDVTPKFQRRGVAQQLLQAIEDIFRAQRVTSCYLEVREDNVAALSLYEKAGYRKIAKLENYYPTGHGLYLKKNL